MNHLDLSKVPKTMKNKFIELELGLKNDNLLRGNRRALQNKRNKLKTQIRAI